MTSPDPGGLEAPAEAPPLLTVDPEPDPHAAGPRVRRPTAGALAGLLGLLVLPAAACMALGVDVAYQGNGIDPFIYVGVVERLHDFLLRWPTLYFPYRFGYIVPEWASERLLGDRPGFLALRFLLLGLVAVTLTGRGRIARGGAAAGALVIVLSPVVHRALFSTYTESLAFAFLMLGAALLIDVTPQGRRGLLRCLAGGAVLALAFNAQFATLSLAGIVCVVVLVDSVIETRRTALRQQLGRAAAIAVGMVAVTGAGVVIYGVLFGTWDVFTATLEFARQPINPVFIDTHADFFTWRHYLLVMPLSLVAGAVAWRRCDDPALRRALRRLVWIVAASTAVFSYLEWGRDGAILSVYYYSSYPMALAVLLLGRSLATVLAARRRDRTGLALVAVSCAAPLVAYAWLGRIKPAYAVLVLLGVLVCVGAWFAARRRALVPIAVLGVVAVAAYATVSSPHDFPGASPTFRLDPRYDATLWHYSDPEADVYAVTDEYARALPSLPGARGEIRVWFDSDPASVTNQVQSALAHLIGALQLGSDPPMPSLAEFPRKRLDVDRPRFVVLLDTSDADVSAGERALADAGEPYEVRWRRRFHHGTVTVFATLLERSDGQWRDFPCPGADGAAVPCP